jgi:hypothetical protein
MKIRVGFDIQYECIDFTPIVFMLNVHPSRVADLLAPDRLDISPPHSITNKFDGICTHWVRRGVSAFGTTRPMCSWVLCRPAAEAVWAFPTHTGHTGLPAGRYNMLGSPHGASPRPQLSAKEGFAHRHDGIFQADCASASFFVLGTDAVSFCCRSESGNVGPREGIYHEKEFFGYSTFARRCTVRQCIRPILDKIDSHQPTIAGEYLQSQYLRPAKGARPSPSEQRDFTAKYG